VAQLSLIDSFANRELAEFAQSRLKDEGIESSLENATLLGWYWQFGVAVGGVKLFVNPEDVARAHEALTGSDDEPSQPTELCPQCHEALLPSWDTCWRCAAQSEQTQDLRLSEPSRAADGDQVVMAIAVAVIGLATFFALGLTGLLIFVAIVAIVKVIFSGADQLPAPEAEQRRPIDAEAVPESQWNEPAEEMATRAWKASVLGMVWFPPLTLYALYLACHADPPGPPLSVAGKWRLNAALVVSLVTISTWLAFGSLILGF
jgi:hypothetical protein